jgi:hypothetical protein
MRIFLLFIFLVFQNTPGFAQPRFLTGKVIDENNRALPRAAVIAFNKQNNTKNFWTTTNEVGDFKLELENGVDYQVEVSYLGYEKYIFLLLASDTLSELDIQLKLAAQEIDEVVIDYQYAPILIKKDTIVFRLGAYTSGEERKLREALEKLPGIEVDDFGQVRFQSNVVNKTLVESRTFFGGGSKLAIENIPADAVEKIEFISNFSEVDFLKDLLSSDMLAMNVVLKRDRKNLVFGDVEMAVGNQKNHIVHAGLFHFNQSKSLSLIADANSLGKALFSLDDALRFQGGNPYLVNTSRPTFIDLYSLTNSSTQFIKNNQALGGLHYDHTINKKWKITGYGLYSFQNKASFLESNVQYLSSDIHRLELRENNRQERGNLAIGDIKLEFKPDDYQHIYYNGNISLNVNDSKGKLLSNSDFNGLNHFMTSGENQSINWQQYLEWHKSFNLRHTFTGVLSHRFHNNTPTLIWENNQPFLPNFLPLSEADNYIVERISRIKKHSLDAMLKHYWVWTPFTQFNSYLGLQIDRTALFSQQGQLVNDSFLDFSSNGFGNDLSCLLKDYYLGLDLKFTTNNFKTTFTLVGHIYDISLNQTYNNQSTQKQFLKVSPSVSSVLDIRNGEKLHLDYVFKANLPEVSQYNEGFVLTNYNTVFKGNALLKQTEYHSFYLRYNNVLKESNMVFSANTQYIFQSKTIKNKVEYEGTNIFHTPIVIDDPETNWSTYADIQKDIWKVIPSLSVRWSWSKYNQSINQNFSQSTRTNQDYTFGVRLNQKKWPDFRLSYVLGVAELDGITKSNFLIKRIQVRLSNKIRKHWKLDLNYRFQENKNQQTNQNRFSQNLNSSLEYQQDNSGWSLYVSGQNILGNTTQTYQNITEYIITEQVIHLLPRTVLFGVRYKL